MAHSQSLFGQGALAEYRVGVPWRMSEAEFIGFLQANPDVRAEWAGGEVEVMSPASVEHSDLNVWFATVLRAFAKRYSLGRAMGPDVVVRLPARPSRRVPDVFFVRTERLSIVGAALVDGAPDIAVEIVSPDSVARDWREKYLEYEAAGVAEYWIVDPNSQRIDVYHLVEAGRYSLSPERDGRLQSRVLPGFYVERQWFWGAEPKDALQALAELGVLPEARS